MSVDRVVRHRLTAGLVAVSIAAIGCGGGDPPGRAATVSGGAPVEIVGREYSFDPATVVLEDDRQVELQLDNQGSLAHNLRVFGESGDLGGTPTFQGGETQSGTVELDPGAYRLVCTVGNHEELGMTGQLEVR